MPISKLRPTFTLTEDRLKELQAVVPEAFADGRINWDTLREALGETLEDETKEHFGLFWPGKREARGLAAMPSKGTLIPQPGQGVDEDNTHNLFIEGDNLEVLKLLQKSYAGRVKMIYIDPPYNTGNDFVYSDNYSEPLEAYLQRTGQVDETGQMLTTNARANGRYHSNWLNMMYPRLLIARSLLQNNGIIFVSIDDNEVHHLRNLMGEIFGEENLVAQIPWQSRQSVQNDTDISVNHEYIVGYAKVRRMSDRRLKEENAKEWSSLPSFAAYPLPLDSERFSNPDNDRRGPWKADPFDAPNIRPNLTYGITNSITKEEHWPPAGRHWRMEESKYKNLYADGRIVFGKTGVSRPQLKVFYNEKKDYGEIQTSWFSGDIYGTTTNGTREIQDLFDGKAVFDTPKPTTLLKSLLRMASRKDDIILDFFAGSCSIAHAVVSLNHEDGGNRNFICVQLDEPVSESSLAYQQGYRTISEIGRERIRRVLNGPKKNRNGEKKSQELRLDGFKSYGLKHSNFNDWEPYFGKDPAQLELRLTEAETPLIEYWKPLNLLTEILLLQGFPLDSKVSSLPEFKANDVQQVTSDFVGHHLYICLDKKVKAETVAKIDIRPEDILVCLDSALSDEAKVKLADQCNLKVI